MKADFVQDLGVGFGVVRVGVGVGVVVVVVVCSRFGSGGCVCVCVCVRGVKMLDPIRRHSSHVYQNILFQMAR